MISVPSRKTLSHSNGVIISYVEWPKVLFPVYYKLLPFLKMLGPFEDKAAAIAQAKAA